jgi:3-oxoacyl-[acyl-carrier protein] reductase
MVDWLLEIGKNPRSRRLIGNLGLPLPLPHTLSRARGPWEKQPFAGKTATVGGVTQGALANMIAKTLVEGGADTRVASGDLPEGFKTNLAVFDASAIGDPAALRALYDFFHAVAPTLVSSAHIVVVGRAVSEATSAASAAARGALDGFVRSLAKEVGRRGATAQLLIVHAGAETRVPPVLRFFLSGRSAFVTGQTITIDCRVPAPAEPAVVRPLEHKVALVTGAARGIGAATARLLADEGAHVVCVDRPAEENALGQLARDIGASVLGLDIAAKDAPAVASRHVREYHGGVDVVVHNAGVTRDKTIGRMTPPMWDETIAVNLAAPGIDDALLSAGLLRDGGRIVCLASVVGIAGNAGQTNYSASKAGIIGYVRRRAVEVAARGITVNAVAPGLIETSMTIAMPLLLREAGRRLSALGQGGLPSDVGEAIAFLASPGAAGITGGVLRVCGGALLGA